MNDDNTWVYVAAPYTHDDPIINTRHAIDAAEQLNFIGLTPVVPHLTMLWHLISPHDIDYWYEYDLRLLDRCDLLLRLPGPSTGADAEVQHARGRGITIWTDLDMLIDAHLRDIDNIVHGRDYSPAIYGTGL